MKKWPEVPLDKLRKNCDYTQFEFETTEDLQALEGIIGQERAEKAIEFGLMIKSHGYNIYMAGPTGTGKTTYAENLIKKVAPDEDVPDDWCYVYNFERLGQPIAFNLPPGLGKVFCQEFDEVIESLKVEIPKAFDSEDYEKQKGVILKEFQDISAELMEELNQTAQDLGFILKRTSTGFVNVPVIDDKPISPEEYEDLSEEVKEKMEDDSQLIHDKAAEITKKVQVAEKEIKEKVKELDNKIALYAVGHLINDLRDKYKDYTRVIDFLQAVQADILTKLDLFKGGEEESNTLPWLKSSTPEAYLKKYKVNLLVDNSETKGAPVVIETNPTYYNLMGRVEYKNELGVMTTDFTKIKAGALHRANGGYLIIQANDLLTNPQAWDGLKRVLKTKELRIENIGDSLGLMAVATLKPEPININVKVILIGSPYYYTLLYHYDEDFKKLFKIKADFDSEMALSKDHMIKMAEFISSHCRREGLKHFDRTGVAKVIEYSAKLAEHQEKLSTTFNEIVEILYEADAWSSLTGEHYINAEHVTKAIKERIKRSEKYERKLQEYINDGIIMIDVEGRVVGQINGLAVIDLGDLRFGKPSRITATTYVGQRGIVNIERETQMSGNIHDKGLLILGGYLGAKYAQDQPLALSASVCFEQLYDGVDGDSASSTELYAVLSSLSDVPIKQGIAVTGSVNQKGEIQPIGGVTEKVEGFFQVCKERGLTGDQGVIIPHQNVINLMLDEEVIEAVKEGQFRIYPVKTIDEGIEILTDMPAGAKDDHGNYPPETINHLVQKKLQHFLKTLNGIGGNKSERRTPGRNTSGRRRVTT